LINGVSQHYTIYHRYGKPSRRQKTQEYGELTYSHEAPTHPRLQQPELKSPTPSSESLPFSDSINTEDCFSYTLFSPESIKTSEDVLNTSKDSIKESKTKIPTIILNPDQWKTSAPKIMPKYKSEQLRVTFSNNSFHLQATDTVIFRDV
jgi:hypothetical protein